MALRGSTQYVGRMDCYQSTPSMLFMQSCRRQILSTFQFNAGQRQTAQSTASRHLAAAESAFTVTTLCWVTNIPSMQITLAELSQLLSTVALCKGTAHKSEFGRGLCMADGLVLAQSSLLLCPCHILPHLKNPKCLSFLGPLPLRQSGTLSP